LFTQSAKHHQIKQRVIDTKSGLIADGSKLTRFSFTDHDEAHIATRTLLHDDEKQLLINLFKATSKKTSDYAAFSLLDLPLKANLIRDQQHGSIPKTHLGKNAFTQAFVIDLFTEIHNVINNVKISLHASNYIKTNINSPIDAVQLSTT
ncbi:unnamed protein product, partial [marine sediment metagenome]